MPGPRDHDWAHVHVEGDPDAAAPYLPFARKLLGFVKQEAGRNGLLTYSMTRKLEDGAVVAAEIRGGIPRMTIQPVRGAGKRTPLPIQENFVCLPRNTDNPNGLDAEHPELMLRWSDKMGWRTLFFDAQVPAYASLQEPKGTYKAQGGRLGFPEGVRHAGNVDWRARDGVRVSWYGPSARYWYDGWRQPSAQYGRFVFMLGQVLLDVDDYCTASGVDLPNRLVVGAAIDTLRRKLYVMQATMADQPNEVPAASATFAVTPPSPTGPIPLTLYRYDLALRDIPDAMAYRVIPGSHLELWTGSLNEACNPWFFDQSITRAVSYSVPVKTSVYVTASGPTAEDITAYEPVSPSSLRFDLTIEGDTAAVASSVVSLPAGQGRAPIASDFVDDEEKVVWMRRMTLEGDPRALAMQVDDILVPLYFHTDVGGLRKDYYFSADVYWCDARERAVCATGSIERMHDWTVPDSWPAYGAYFAAIELFVVDGVTVANAIISEADAASNSYQHRPKYAFYGGALYPSAPNAWRYLIQSGNVTKTTVAVGLFGFSGQISFTTVPKDEIFGGAAGKELSSGTRLFSDQLGLDPPPPDDKHGKRWLFGAAAHGGRALYSFLTTVFLNNDPSKTSTLHIAHLTDGDLAERTTIGGDDATYTPVWLLGTVPARLTP